MKTARLLTILFFALGVIFSLAKVSQAAPLGTAFTYQGFLQYTGGGAARPEDGLFDFRFSVYDDLNTGTQQGSMININDYEVIEGNLEMKLDFGGGIFTGDSRWLEISVRPGASSDPCDYDTLSPRLELTAAPYALYAETAGSVDWTEVTSRPAGLDDGDDDTCYNRWVRLRITC